MLTIHRRLLYTLFPTLTLLMLAGSYVDYQATVATVNSAFDKQMTKEAIAIASCVTTQDAKLKFVPTSSLEEMLRSGGVSTKLFSIIDDSGKPVAGDNKLPSLAYPVKTEHIRFGETVIGQDNYRIIFLRQAQPATFVVILAHSLADRGEMRSAMITSSLLVDFVELNIVLLVAWLGVRIALRPINMMQKQIEQQSSLQLQQFDDTKIPVEIRPFVVTFNHLVELLDDAAMRQRQFLANAAHQLRTPLTGLQAQLQLLIGKPTAQPLQEELAVILKAFNRLTHSTNQLLMLARAEESLVSISNRFQKLDIKILIQQTVELFLNRADLTQIDLGMEAQSTEILGDINLLEDLLNNLVDNALKYTPLGGQVTVRCGTREGTPFLEVEDTGPGIPESARNKVRERFYRQPDVTGPGSGLGLAIVDDICRVHRARMIFDEGTNHQGALVTVLFSV